MEVKMNPRFEHYISKRNNEVHDRIMDVGKTMSWVTMSFTSDMWSLRSLGTQVQLDHSWDKHLVSAK